MSAPGTGDEVWHRLSPRMLIVHPVIEVGRLLPVIAGIVLAGSGHDRNLVPGVAVTVAVTALAIARWFTTRVRITPTQVELTTGVFRRRALATRRDRIRTVDVTSHLLHRLLGLARVVVGTGISDRKGRDRLVLDGLTRADADRLRDELLHASTAAPVDAATSAPAVSTIARLDRRWIGYAPFTLSGVVTGLLVWGFLWRLQGDGVDVLHSGPFRAATRSAERSSTIVLVLAAIVLLVIFVVVTSAAGYVLAFWNFRLGRHVNGTVEVTRGLLTTRATSIERRRLVGVRIVEPLPLRLVHGSRLVAIATGLRVGRGAERGGEVLAPPAPAPVIRDIARDVLDGTAAVEQPLRRHGSAALRRRLVRAVGGGTLLIALAVVGRLTGGSGWPITGAAVLLVLSVPLAYDRYRNLGHAVCERYLVVGSGSLVRRRGLLHGDAVIGWTVRRSWFQRRAGLATVVATTAAGRQSERLLDVPSERIEPIVGTLTPSLWAVMVKPARPPHGGAQ